MARRLAYGVLLAVTLTVVCGGSPAWANASGKARANALAASFAERAGLTVPSAGRLSLRLGTPRDLLAATTLPAGGHDWKRNDTGRAVSAELTYFMPLQGRWTPYVGLSVTHFTAIGTESPTSSPATAGESRSGVGAHTGLTVITSPRGQIHLGVAVALADRGALRHTPEAEWGQLPADATRLDVALTYSLHF